MNKYARIMYGKISHIYETEREFSIFKKLFSPNALFINITSLDDVAVGYRVDFISETEFNVIPPKVILPETLEEAKARKLNEIAVWTENQITSGFISNVTGENVTYDSDVPTQITMQGIAVNTNSEVLNTNYPDGCPVRGYPEGSSEKVIYMFNGEQILQWCADLSLHIGKCKIKGWTLQDQVKKCSTVEEVNKVIIGDELDE